MQPQQLTIIILLLISAFPIGFGLSKLTADEKSTYRKYFPPFLWISAIAAAIFYTINITYALILTFIFLVILSWNYNEKLIKSKKSPKKQ